ncbi:restriction endonuclease subunit S [Dietzia massiliensis]|uniref:restriction endonuclease subunit S n=1 Tax=Dietzia massiliensis TaxID=2697499 RepID=UPI001BCE3B6A|nr:restriction endonuclease subunit S [Dietzia massiliensis]MBS7548230.1 restriction endonuclease subunit S [Dietzia massiliensis]
MSAQIYSDIRLSRIAATPIINGIGEASDVGEPDWPRYIRITDIRGLDQLKSEDRMSLEPALAAKATVKRDDILMAAVGATVGSAYIHQSDDPACFAGYLVRFRADKALAHPRFVAYWTQSSHYGHQIRSGYVGSTIENFSASKYRAMRIPLPGLADQREISQFLDRETAKIDALIDKQEQLIATLRDDRAATITQAVTKGLDSQVELRESGVRWMGAIPAHWCVDRIKNSVESARNGVWGAEPDGGSEDIRCVRVADFDRPQLAIHDRNITYRKVTSSERSGRILQRGDLLLEKSGGGDKNPVGFVVLYEKDEPAICSNFVARVQLAPNQDPKFWTYVHHCLYQSRLTYPSIKQNTGIQNLDQQSYFNERVGFPPFAEQSEIVKFLDSRCSRIDALIDKSVEMIETLSEYRSALITNAVTGKIDVREAV